MNIITVTGNKIVDGTMYQVLGQLHKSLAKCRITSFIGDLRPRDSEDTEQYKVRFERDIFRAQEYCKTLTKMLAVRVASPLPKASWMTDASYEIEQYRIKMLQEVVTLIASKGINEDTLVITYAKLFTRSLDDAKRQILVYIGELPSAKISVTSFTRANGTIVLPYQRRRPVDITHLTNLVGK